MSRAALSARAFAVYLFIVGGTLVLAPNALLSILQMPRTTEVWVHVVGVLALVIGTQAWVAATHDNTSFLVASVYTRLIVFVAFGAFAVLGLASPVLAVFGTIDLLAAAWTHFALQADARRARVPL